MQLDNTKEVLKSKTLLDSRGQFGPKEYFTIELRPHMMLWDYIIILYWKSKEGYLHISTCILRSSILLSFLLQAVFIPKTKLETNWTTLFNFKNHMYIIWICEFKKLATTDMVSIHLLVSTWNPNIVCLVTLMDCKTMLQLSFLFVYVGVGWGAGWGEGWGGRRHTCTCGWFTMFYGRSQHNIVKQLFSN